MVNAIKKMQPKKRGRPAIGQGTPIQVRLQPDQLEALDAWIAATSLKLTRQDALRRLLAIVSTVPGATPDHAQVTDHLQMIDRGRRRAAAYARDQGSDDYAEKIIAGSEDDAPLVRAMMWLALP